jgi:micrococcal nuclease
MGFVKINQTKLRSAATSLFDVGRWTLRSAGGGQVLARLWRVRCSVCLIFLILFASAHYASAQTWFTVKWVNDGDTIILTNGKRVRYIGINAPEIDHDKQGAQPFGHAAKTFNKQMVLNRKIRLDFDLERQDRYGRLLAYIFLPDGTFLNEHMLQNGYAFFLFRKPNLKYNQRLLKAQQEAMKAHKGLWNGWNEQKKRYVGNRNSRRFHMESCPHARNIKWKNRTYFSTKWEAFEVGYAPAGGCIKEFWSYGEKD